MTKEATNNALRWINTTMSGIAVFLLIAMYNRFEKKLDQVDALAVGQATMMGKIEVFNQSHNLIESTFENQLKTANMLMDKVEDCDMRLDYIELYVDHPKPMAAKKK